MTNMKTKILSLNVVKFYPLTTLATSLLSMAAIFAATMIPVKSWARPEFALKTAASQCTVCHVNPYGGGLRTVYGKIYGAKGLNGISSFSNSDTFSADIRALGYSPRNPDVKTSGFTMMDVTAGMNIPLNQDDSGVQSRMVMTYGFGELFAGLKDTFLLFKTTEQGNLLIGKFIKPFGLLTDEHRTYTKMQTNSSIQDYEYGMGVAHDFETLHMDATYTDDSRSKTLANEPVITSLLNVRWTPVMAPVMLGGSVMTNERQDTADSSAASIYGGLSFDRWTDSKIPVTYLIEVVQANGWNQQVNKIDFFGVDTAFKDAVKYSESLGTYMQLTYDVVQRFTLLAKYDQLVFDKSYKADAFNRYGIGGNYTLNANSVLMVRYEIADSGYRTLDKSQKFTMNSLYFVIKAGF